MRAPQDRDDRRRVTARLERIANGCTAWESPVFPDLVSDIEKGESRPLVEGVYPLDRIADPQRAFQDKRHIGKIVLIPST